MDAQMATENKPKIWVFLEIRRIEEFIKSVDKEE